MPVKTTNISQGKDEEEEMTTNNMEMELTSLTLQLLTLTQDLVNAKLRMEDTAKVRGLCKICSLVWERVKGHGTF